MSHHLVIVGAGQAATQLIVSSRQLGFEGPITMIADEPHLPYQRPPLSKKYLTGEFERSRLFLKPDSFFGERGVELMRGVRAIELDAEARTVRLEDNSRISFDKLALATGASVRRLDLPGSALAGIHYLRTVDDVDAIRSDLGEARRVVIIGAGYIGLEVAASCASMGLEVTVLESGPRILGRVVSGLTAEFFAALHAEHGVSIHCDTRVSGFAGNDRVSGVLLDDGTVHECDCAIIGIGVVPNTSLARTSGLACENGISVDAETRTSLPDIVAIGDCTSHPHPSAGTRVRLESVQNAIEQGKSAASTLFAEPRAFSDVPWFWSDQYDLKLQIAGLAQGYDTTVLRGDPASKSFAVYYLDGRRLVAVDAVGAPRDFVLAKKLLSARASLDPTAIADTSANLEQLATTA